MTRVIALLGILALFLLIVELFFWRESNLEIEVGISLGILLLSLMAFGNAIAKFRNSTINSVNSHFWFQKVVAPTAIDSLLGFAERFEKDTASAMMESHRAKIAAYRRFALDKKQLVFKMEIVSVLSISLRDDLTRLADEFEDNVASFLDMESVVAGQPYEACREFRHRCLKRLKEYHLKIPSF